MSEEKLRHDTRGKNTGLDALERIRGTWPASSCPPQPRAMKAGESLASPATHT